MPKEILTLYTKLLVNRGAGDEELIDLLSTPDLGIGDPEKVEVTNLQDGTRRYVNGLKDVGDSLEFEFNYVTDNYQVLKEIEESKEIYTYKVVLPDKLCFTFEAALSVKITGAAVGEQVKMTINLTPYSTIDVVQYEDNNAGQQSRYSTFTIGQSRARSAGILSLYGNAEQPIEELYINDVAQELPTGVIQDWDDTAATNYEVNPGDVVKIKGGFSLYGTELPIEDVVLQNDLIDCEGMFEGCTGLMVAPEIPEGVTDCNCMFDYCTGLTEAPIIPSSVSDCSGMFSGCTSLTEAPIIPNSVTTCGAMFSGCTSLTEAPVIPSSVSDCSSMFSECTNLTQAPVIPTSVTNCSGMFYGCTSLAQAPVIPSSVRDCSYMFYDCTSLTEAPVIPTTVTDCSYMFNGCSNLTTIPQENIDMMSNPPEGLIFEGCYMECPLVADSIPTSWGGTKVEEPETPETPAEVNEYTTFTINGDCNMMISVEAVDTPKITELYIDDVQKGFPTTAIGMTYNVKKEQKVKIKGHFRLSNANITEVKIQSNLTSCNNMFMDCSGLTKAPVIPNGVTNCNSMFGGCTSLTEAPVIPSTVTSCTGMFYNCTNLTTLPSANVDLMSNHPDLLNYRYCYKNCTNINKPISYNEIPDDWK